MFARIDNLPAGAIGFEAVGRVTDEDRYSVLEPTIVAALENGHQVRLLYVAGARFDGYDPSGLRRYVRRLQPAAARKNSALPQKEARLEALEGVSNGTGLVSSAEFLRVREQLRDLLGFTAQKARAVPRLSR